MALMTWKHDGTVRRTGGTSTSWGRFELDWSGLPENIRIKRIYWQWDVSRQKGSVYARWYYGTSGDTLNGNTGMNGTAFQFDVTSKVTISGTSGTAWVYLGAQYGWADYSNISFNIEFDYLQSSFTLSTTNVNAGAAITANIAIQDPTATHKATWQFGTRTNVVTTGAGVATSSFTPPLAWLDQIPNAVSGLASCTLETINSAGTVVGSQVLYFNILAPSSVVPSISAFTATRVDNSVPSAWGVYVQGQSGVTVKATAAGAYGSTITGYTLTGDGKTASAATLSIAKLSGSGTLTFKATVVDSRGRSASKTLTIDVVDWSTPTIKTLSVGRCNADGSANPAGSSILVSLTGAIASVSGKNTASVTVKYRAQGSATWLSGATGAVASGSWVIAANAALPTNAYEVQAVLTDAFTSATQTTVLPTAECFLDQMPGRKRLGIGGYNATDKSVYINPEWGIHWGEKRITDSPRNLLDNSDFSNPVAQTGLNGLHGSTKYVCDRWVGHANVTAAQQAGGITLTANQQYAYIYQRLNLQIGKTYTLVLRANNISSAHCIAVYNGALGAFVKDDFGSAETLIVTFTAAYDTMAMLYYPGYSSAGGSSLLKWAALYEGEYTAGTLPEYVPKGYAAELAECQRYFFRFDARVNAAYIPCIAGTTQIAGFLFPTAMRIVPTMTIEELTMWTAAGATDVSGVISSKRCTTGGLQYIELTTAPANSGLVVLGADFSADL